MLLIRRRKKERVYYHHINIQNNTPQNNQSNTNPCNILKSKANNFKLRKASVVVINTAYYERFML